MAGKSTLPLLAVAGIAAIALTRGKKKKKKEAAEVPEGEEGEIKFPEWAEEGISDIPGAGPEISPEGGDKLVFDEACQAFVEKLNADAHNVYITGMFDSAVKQGVTSAEQIVQGMLGDQAPQCPWGIPASYTPLMQGVYDQLLGAVREYARMRGIELL